MDCFYAKEYQLLMVFIELMLLALAHGGDTPLGQQRSKAVVPTDSTLSHTERPMNDQGSGSFTISTTNKQTPTKLESGIPTLSSAELQPLQHSNKMRHAKRKWRSQRQIRQVQPGYHSIHGRGRTWKSCQTKSSFTHLREAVDMFGNTVSVYPSVHIGKVAVDQYFYETFCDKEACQCSGVDETRYHSSCETTHSFTYARVFQRGKIGWTKIMVRSGCGCVLRERKWPRWIANIMDSI